ncbi:unnamed protein product [Effrenium voratum]|nr:unnamed protein product [Effrenium voratum]
MGSSLCHLESEEGGELCDRAPKCAARCDAVPCSGSRDRSREDLADWTKLELGLATGRHPRRAKPTCRRPVVSPGCLVTRYFGTTEGIGADASYQEPPDPAEVYELKPRPIGFGSSGEVLLARHRSTRALRALKKKSKVSRKRLIVDEDEGQPTPHEVGRRRRDEVREVEALLRLDHPNVVKLFEVFEDQDSICLVLELLPGSSLLELLMPKSSSPRAKPDRDVGRTCLPEMEAAEFFWQMLSAVLHLHGQRVVHRDIKLEHFIQAEGGVLKLVDFGHAWPLQPFSSPEAAEAVIEVMVVQELTIPGGAGTSRYIAPEIQDESEVAAHLADRADMWALGVCLHAMLTGRLLPNCGTLTKVASINSAISQVDEGVLSASAHDLLEQLLQLKPENRPTSAAVARHPWLARAAHADLHPVMDLLSHSRFITDLGVIADAKPIRRLFLLVVAHELEDAQTYPYQALFRWPRNVYGRRSSSLESRDGGRSQLLWGQQSLTMGLGRRRDQWGLRARPRVSKPGRLSEMKVEEGYESLAAYRARAERISHALEVLGQEVGPADLRSVIMKAELIQEGYEALGDFDPRTMVGHLREQFIMLANDDTKEPEEKGLTTVAIAELIQDLGGRVSTAPDKVFSTPSDELHDDRNRGSKRSREPTDGDEGVVALRSKMVAMQMELESLKKDKDKDRAASEASSPEKELANALEHQTAALMKALEGRNQSQVMSVKADLQWPTLGDERSDSKDVSEFYDHFEDNCGLANSCKGMNYREMLLALRSRQGIEKDPEKVYKRIKAKHLLFTESPEASVTELETVGLGKSKRELYLSYLRKMPAHLQKVEQREATHRATANAVYSTETERQQQPPKKEPKKPKEPKAPKQQVLAATEGTNGKKLCFHYRDHGTCPWGDKCHDKELRKKALAEKKQHAGKYDGKSKKEVLCPFFRKNGACKKGSGCDMLHALVIGEETGRTQGVATQQSLAMGPKPDASSLINPFAALSVTIGEYSNSEVISGGVLKTSPSNGGGGPGIADLDDLPKDWWEVVQNESGGYQYRTVVKILGKQVECMLDGGAGANHITEELVVSMVEHARKKGVKPDSKDYPILRFEKWVFPEFVHGIASGKPVPLKGSVVLRARLQEGPTPEASKDGPELYIRCKIAAKGCSDWHGIILGGRALDCEARGGLGFRPGPGFHFLDTVGVKMPRCEDHSKGRHDRAYPFSVASSLDDHSALPRDGAPTDLLVAACGEPVELFPGDGVLIPVDRVREGLDVDDQGRSCEAILPISDSVEAVPGIWPTGSQEGMVLIAAKYEPVVIEAGETVAEVRRGRIAASECTRCHMWDSKFQDSCHFEDDSCSSCGTGILRPDSCSQCGSEEVRQVRLQGCEECIATDLNKEGAAREDEEVLPERASGIGAARISRGNGRPRRWGLGAFAAMIFSVASLIGVNQTMSRTKGNRDFWEYDATERTWARKHLVPRRALYSPIGAFDCPFNVGEERGKRITRFECEGSPEGVLEDDWRTVEDPHRDLGKPWVGTTYFFMNRGEAGGSGAIDTRRTPVYHIVEVPGEIERMGEMTPTDSYYEQLHGHLRKKYPKADPHLLDHLSALEAFLDKSIVFGFSYGLSKAEIAVMQGKLLGHHLSRGGVKADPERSQAVRDFPPLREKLHIQQFLGCGNWLRAYLPVEYGHAAKILNAYQKPGAIFPEGGLGSANTDGCKAVKAIKRMMTEQIELSIFDEATAITGECPLEQIADASGIAVGGTVLQMSRDRTKMKVLLTHSKSLTPPQQAWPPLIQEAFAQLEVKRASRKVLGTIRAICWTDHANLTRAQGSDIGGDVKLLRWVAEIIADGSEIRSLAAYSQVGRWIQQESERT